MRSIFMFFTTIFLVVSNSNSFSQEKKYQSLLWEISGNGLEKKSYLYGTMHVSEKISYHLSSIFFENLLSADFVATESDPSTWDDAANLYSLPMDFVSTKFYSSFYSFPIEKKDLFSLFKGINYGQTALMSRTEIGLSDYQEDTYLDMFIYRTGRKYGKKCVGLENAKESLITIQKGRIDAENVDFNYDEQGLNRLQKSMSSQELLQEYYREKNLDMLDSLMKLTTHPKVLEGLLYKRNITMAHSMDSIMKLGSLFAGVGASHLPGDLGMIEILRKKGYTVTPIMSDYNDKGRIIKKEIDEFYLTPILKSVRSADGMIELPLFDHYTEDNERIESSDIVNGGYINVKRISIKDYLKKEDDLFNSLMFDSLFFENIPGDIIEKKTYVENGYTVYDITSITKTKKAEHYRYYFTPLEVIAVIMGGEGDYVRKYESLVYDNIKIKEVSNQSISFIPKRGGFEISCPSYYKSSGDYDFNQPYRNLEIQAYDQENDSYYFLIEKTATEISDLYNSKFELERIAYEFLFQLDAIEMTSSFDSLQMRNNTDAKIGDKYIHLMTTMYGSKYYLLGTVNASKNEYENYFESFKNRDFEVSVELSSFHDESGQMSIEIPKHYNEHLQLDLKSEAIEWSSKNKFNVFEGKGSRFIFYNPTGEIVELGYYNYGKYNSFKSREEFWKDFRKNITANYESEEDTLVDQRELLNKHRKELNYNASRWQFDFTDPQNTKDKYILRDEVLSEPDENGMQILTGLIINEHSSIATRIEAVLTNNSFYYIQAAVEKAKPSRSEFVNQSFESFKIVPTKIEGSVFEDKVDQYILDVRSQEDSIHYSAIQSTVLLVINDNNLEKIKDFLDVYEFQQDELDAQFELIRQIIDLDENLGISYLEKIYKSQNVLPSTQLEVLQVLILVDNKKAFETIQELMEFDLPLTESNYEISLIFNLMKQTKNSELLFPDILQYYVVPEYNGDLIDFTENAVISDKVSSRKLKSYRKLLLTNAKLEYKRLKSWKNEQDLVKLEMYDMPYYYNDRSRAPINNLLSYIHILSVFKNDKDVNDLLLKIEDLDIDEYYLDQLDRKITKSQHVDDKLLERLSRSSETKFSVLQAMHQLNKHTSLNTISEDSIAFYAISQFNRLKSDSDSLTFFEKRTEEFEGRTIRYFFYKVTDISEDSEINKSEKIAGVAFVLEEDKINPQSFRSFKMKQFIDEKDLRDYILISLDEWKYLSNKRVNHGKYKSTGSYDYYGNDFFQDDYYEDDYYEGGF